MTKNKWPFWGLGILTVIALVLVFESPDSVVVDPSGRVVGTVNILREKVQGQRFWWNQLQVLDEELHFARNFPAEMEQLQREVNSIIDPIIDPIIDEADRELEEFYSENPELQPSPAELAASQAEEQAREAEVLRDKQDMRHMFLATIKELEEIRPHIMAQIDN